MSTTSQRRRPSSKRARAAIETPDATRPVVDDADFTGAPLLSEPSPLVALRHHPINGPILDQEQLRQALKLTRLAHRTPGLQAWTGAAGVGKTVAAEQLAFECNAEVEAGKPGAYRAFYFMTGGDVDHGSTRQMKRGIYVAYEQMVDELTSAELRQRSETALAAEVVEQARLTNTQLLVVDEAGTKTSAEIRGLALICDLARQRGWPFSILLVGMDDLAAKMTKLHVLRSRTRLTQIFRAWEEADCLAYIASRSDTLSSKIEERTPGIGVLCNVLIKHTGGRLREIETLLPEVEHRLKKGRSPHDVIRNVIGWRTEANDAALAQALEYQARQRQREVAF